MKYLILILLSATGILLAGATMNRTGYNQTYSFKMDTLTYVDSSRNRKIPVALYRPEQIRPGVIIFSHGYGQNRGGDYLAYSYLTDFLAAKGYFVASIQHELPTDELMPATGIPQIVRRPFWERGADNIQFVINQLKKGYPDLDFNHITLIGHSNGGDMTALFPQKYPGIASKIITLDNRRMPFPYDRNLKIYSLRSGDQPADEGVVPAAAEMKRSGMVIIKLADVKHDEMDDHANAGQRKVIRQYVLKFLNDPF